MTAEGLTLSTSPTRPRSKSEPSSDTPARLRAPNRPASSPERPTASGPCWLSRPTSSRPTWPVRTIRTTSITSGVVTRSPFRNSLVSPSRPSICAICGPPPCTTTGRRPAYRRKATSCAKARLRVVVDHRVAAVLDDDERAPEPLEPRQRLDEGLRLARRNTDRRRVDDAADGAGGGRSGVVLMCCTPSSRGRSRGSGRWSRPSTVSSPAWRSTRTWTSRSERSTSDRSSPTPPARQTWTPFMETSSVSASKVAAVVPTAARTRPQLGSAPKIAHLKRLLRATLRATSSASSTEAAPRTSMAMSWWAPSASATSWRARSAQTTVTASVSAGGSTSTADAPDAMQEHRVVGRLAAVGVDAVEGRERRRAQRLVHGGGVGRGVGDQDDEHRRQRRREHARALRHPPDRPAVALERRGLGVGVGGDDRGGGIVVAVGRERGRRGRDARADPVHREQLADEPRGADGDVDGRQSERVGHLLGRAVRVLEPLVAGARVGPAGVEDDRVDASVRDDLARPDHRRRDDPVAGEHRGRVVVGPVVDDEGEVGLAARLEPGGDAGGAEAGGESAHGATPATGRPVVSGRPRARFAHWIAPPAVPLVRLSMAATTTTRPTDSSSVSWR